MSSDPSVFSGEVILHAVLKVKPGKSEEIATLLSTIRAHSTSDNEPGCSTYRTCRSGDTFMIFEKYTSSDAVKEHMAMPQFKALAATFTDYLVEPPTVVFYEEFN